MDQLPVELVEYIIDFIPFSDLKHLRLVCRAFSSMTARLLFRNVHLHPHPYSYQQLDLILDCPSLAQHIRCLCHYIGLVDIYGSFESWYEDGIGSGLTSDDYAQQELLKQFSTDELNMYYQRYRHYLEWQNRMLGGKTYQDSLQKAICRIPGLTEVNFGFESHSEYNGTTKFRLGLFPGHLSAIAGETLLLPDDRTLRSQRLHGHLLGSLIHALSAVPKSLSSISVNAPWSCLDLPDGVSDEFNDVFSRVQQLKFHVQYAWAPESDGDPAELHQQRILKLSSILATSSCLEHLDLSFGYNVHHHVTLTDCLAFEPCWPQLKSLKLHSLMARQEALERFFRECSNSLKYLALGDIYLDDDTGGSWLTMFRVLHEVLKLDRIKLFGRFDSQRDEAWSVSGRYGCGYNDIDSDVSCLRYRMERFIIQGGECPLPSKTTTGRAQRIIWEAYCDGSWLYDEDV